MILWWCNAGMVGFLTNGVGVFQFLLFTSCIYFSDSQILRLCADKNDGDPCLLSCQTSDVNQVISISKSPTYAAAGSCLSDGTCFSADNLLYNISQSAPYTNLEIFSFNKSDNATWRCEYTGNPPYDIFLSWSKLPTSIMELSGLTSNVTITNDLTISVEVGCLYSLNDPITNLQLMCAGTLVTTHAMSCIPSTTVCSDSDLSAYICNYTITSNPPSQTCNSGNTGYSLKAVVSFDDTTQSYDKNIFVLYTVSFESVVATTPKPTTKPLPDQRCFLGIQTSNPVCGGILVGIAFVVIGLAYIIYKYIFYQRMLKSKKNDPKLTGNRSKDSNKLRASALTEIQNDQDSRKLFTGSENKEDENQGITPQAVIDSISGANNDNKTSAYESEINDQHRIENVQDKSNENSNTGRNDTSTFNNGRVVVSTF